MHMPRQPALAAGAMIACLAIGMVPVMQHTVMAQETQVDMDKVFRCAATDADGKKACATARELILGHCTACHTFVPIVMQQFDAKGWQASLDRHRPRVPELSSQQIQIIADYLTANFNPETPPPDLPPDLLKNWTSY